MTKQEQLHTLASKVDLWVNTPMSETKQNKVKNLLEELSVKLDDIDEIYLDTKLDYYTKLYELLKTPNVIS